MVTPPPPSFATPPAAATPLKHLQPGWFAMVMGLCGLSLAWARAVPVFGEPAWGVSLGLGVLAALVFVVLAIATLLRWQRHPEAWDEDRRHPVRHPFVATLPIALILLATVGNVFLADDVAVQTLWVIGSAAQFGVTLWVLARWLRPGKEGLAWATVTPALFLAAVGNVLVPLAGVNLGYEAWSAAQGGIGLLLWPVVLALLWARLAVQGLWPERLLPTTFISVAPPSAGALALLQLGAPELVGWMLWGVALLMVAWSVTTLPRIAKQPFAITFWSMSFPMAAFTALTLHLTRSGPAWGQTLSVLLLAAVSLLIGFLLMATYKGWRGGTLLVPETVAVINPAN